MKCLVPLLASLLAVASCVDVRVGDRTITQVVKLLQGMLDSSKTESKEERQLFAKYKCYCDTNEEEKTTSIEDLTKEIGLLENQITALQGSNGVLSTESAKMKREMDSNQEQQGTAVTLRSKANQDFLATESDLDAAIGQLGQAIDTLTAIGADQSLQASAAHEKFMANYPAASLARIQTTVKKALVDAEAFLKPAQRKRFNSFLQAPFSQTYVTQSGGIVGILKSMKETFESNLESARTAEAAQVKAHDDFMNTKQSEYNTLDNSYNTKQGLLSDNDGTLSSKKGALGAAEQQLSDDQAFLAQLTTMCEEKAKEFEKRKLFRANEEAAIAQAIAILNSDKAFAAFGRVDATRTGGTGAALVQIRSHAQIAPMSELATYLRHIAQTQKSARVAKVAALVAKMNPFTVVLNEIDKMKALIQEEADLDQKQLDWCTSERQTNGDNLNTKTGEITTLEGRIGELETNIDDPQTGLKKQIDDKEDSLTSNYKQQQDETSVRREENKVYQETVGNVQEATVLLDQAIIVLKKYYAALEAQVAAEAGGFIQKKKENPAEGAPETWSGSYAGQSQQGGDVIQMLEYILSQSKQEETDAHDEESQAQALYEDSMTKLKQDETDLQGELVGLQKNLADAKEELLQKREDLETAIKDKTAIERYLEQIKPGCDFITDNFQLREGHRSTEMTALNTAVEKLKATPAFQAAAAEDQNKDWGVCAEKCGANEAHVDCQACLAKVTVPGYCAGHPTTPGC